MVVPSASEKSLADGIPNGHATPVQDSPFIGYIIAMHRKMVVSAHQSFHHKHYKETKCQSTNAVIPSLLDADRIILSFISEEPAQFVWHASHCALHSAHQ